MKANRTLNLSLKAAVSTAAFLTFAVTSEAQNTATPINVAPTNSTNAAMSIPNVTASSTDIPAVETVGSETPTQNASSLQEHTTVQYRDAMLIDVIRHLCEESKINHVISPKAIEASASKTVTLKLTDVTYEVVLKTILDSYQLGTVLENGIVRIDTIDNIKRDQEDKRKIKDERVKQEPTRVAIYQLNYVKSDQTAPLVAAAMKSHSTIDARFSVQADARANRLIVEGVQEAQVRVKTLIENLDKRKQQVVIEARVIEASSALRRGIGINWGTRFGLDAGRGLSTGLIFPNSIIGNIGGAGEVVPDFGIGKMLPKNNQMAFSIGTINGMFNIDGILKAYETESQVNIIAQPTLTVMDNEKGEFTEIIDKNFVIPPPPGATASTAATVSNFKMKLGVGVTPMIAADGSIELDVDVERESGEPGASASATYQSKISRRAKTKLAVRHGDTAVIGGLYTTTKQKSTSRIPLLGSIPILGFLFRDTSTLTDRTELMILLTPRLVSNATGGAVATTSDFAPMPSTPPPAPTPVLNPTGGGNDGINQGLDSNFGSDNNLAKNSAGNSVQKAEKPSTEAPVGNNMKELDSLNSAPTNGGAGGGDMGLEGGAEAPMNSSGGNSNTNNMNSLE